MTVTTTVKKIVTDNTYAVVGVTDYAVEQVRNAGTQLDAARAELRTQVQTVRSEYAPKNIPAKVAELHADLAERGEKLVQRVRNQKATQDLVHQAEATVALGKGAITTARKAADDIERSAKATVTTGRHEAEKAVAGVKKAIKVEVDTDAAEKAVADAAKRTRTAAKRTSTTAKNSAARTKTATKATATSARKTAAKSAKATEKAGEKVGD
ncbi:hypothetical protein [Janibacter sp. GXQ6167]|uniref:hypothetical protein n=1 Tax=Janibacter sp. GXQ6167 TaxID=3240791 RepID=UPI003525F958